MNCAAVIHRPLSEYACALDETHYVFRLRAQRGDLKRCEMYYADRSTMSPQLSFQPTPMALTRQDKLYDWFEFALTTPLNRIAYYFLLDDGETQLYFYGDCFETRLSAERSDYFQLPYNHRADRLTVPQWVFDAVVYNIFPDSFASGKRCLSGTGSTASYQGEVCASRLGGTIRGITENLDYISQMGFNCLYLNPLFAAVSYHKYDLLDYYHIDPCRGTDEDFRTLIQKAHALGLRVVIDGVFNHMSWRHFIFQDVLKNGEKSPYYDWFYALPQQVRFPSEGEAPDYACFAYVPEMPKTDTSNPGVCQYFCDVGAYWIREFDVDGWRLDVANEVDDGFLRAFRQAVKQAKPDALVIGEVWENASHYLMGDMLDSAMNYDFRRFCRQFFAESAVDAETFDLHVSGLLTRYKPNALPAQLNVLDSHDVSRFLSLCHGNLDRMELAVLFQMTFMGMPSVFYGDEQGLTGVGEEDYRQGMRWQEESASLEDVYRKCIALRTSHPAFARGSFETLQAQGGLYVYRRALGKSWAVVCLNAGEAAVAVAVQGQAIFQKRLDNGILSPWGYAVFASQEEA